MPLVSIEAADALEKEDGAFLLCILIEDATFIRFTPRCQHRAPDFSKVKGDVGECLLDPRNSILQGKGSQYVGQRREVVYVFSRARQ